MNWIIGFLGYATAASLYTVFMSAAVMVSNANWHPGDSYLPRSTAMVGFPTAAMAFIVIYGILIGIAHAIDKTKTRARASSLFALAGALTVLQCGLYLVNLPAPIPR